MEAAKSYQVQLEFFQGPLDLLLFLIKKKKIDIHDIPIATITREYLDYLNQKEKINLDREVEFLFIASLLIYIKSQVLLPRQKPDEEEPEEVIVDGLQDYQKIKAASLFLREKEEKEIKKWKRPSLLPLPIQEEIDLEDISLFELAESFFLLMKRKEKENIQIIKGKEYSIEEKMKEIVSYLEENIVLDFFDYFYNQDILEEALISFFSLLELIKTRIVIAIQESLFRTIKVWLRKKPSPRFSR